MENDRCAAVDRYIESKSSILSPSTVLGYKRTKSA